MIYVAYGLLGVAVLIAVLTAISALIRVCHNKITVDLVVSIWLITAAIASKYFSFKERLIVT